MKRATLWGGWRTSMGTDTVMDTYVRPSKRRPAGRACTRCNGRVLTFADGGTSCVNCGAVVEDNNYPKNTSTSTMCSLIYYPDARGARLPEARSVPYYGDSAWREGKPEDQQRWARIRIEARARADREEREQSFYEYLRAQVVDMGPS